MTINLYVLKVKRLHSVYLSSKLKLCYQTSMNWQKKLRNDQSQRESSNVCAKRGAYKALQFKNKFLLEVL